MKSRGGKSQRREEKKKDDQGRERVRRQKMQVREKVRVAKSRNTVFFQWFVAPEGRKVGSLKRRVRSHVVRWEMTSCTPLWREAHVQVKMYRAHHARTIFGSWDVDKVYAVVARGTFRSQKCRSDGFGALLDVQMSFSVAGAEDCAPCLKWEKTWESCSSFSYNHHYATLHSTTTTTTITSTTTLQ